MVLFLASAMGCSFLPWGKRSPYSGEELAKLVDKDIYVIDGEKYIKVHAGKDERGNTKFRYVKVEKYLAGEVEPLSLEAERVKRTPGKGVQKTEEQLIKKKEQRPPSSVVKKRHIKFPYLKRKVAILKFEDLTQFTYERFGEIIAQRLAKKMEEKVFTSLVMDRETVKHTCEELGLTVEDLKDPSKAKLLNETLGIQGIIMGAVYGPFATSSAPTPREKSSMAIVQIEVEFIDAARGCIVKKFAITNPLAESEQLGVLSEEKARYRAVDLAIDQILAQVAEEINRMEWFARIALVEGEKVYLNAGHQTGLKEGDLLEVYPAGDLIGTKPIGKIKVFELFGIDASVAKVIEGGGFQINDVAKPIS
ncbi:MAG: hypothetical protein DRG50_04985 [Deltaproteobacteria bacterium]|nr:MAG: hypothetical protein DRG50_04985 [Deltaproteobacteria bacterium]